MPPVTRGAHRSSELTTPPKKSTRANRKASTAAELDGAIDKVQREMAIAGQAFEEQEDTLRHINAEAEHHEKIIWQQQRELSRLQKVENKYDLLKQRRREVPYTAAEDLAGVLNSANYRMYHEMTGLRKRNAYLEDRGQFLKHELLDARAVVKKTFPAQIKLREENGRLRAELSQKEQLVVALSDQVDALKEKLGRS